MKKTIYMIICIVLNIIAIFVLNDYLIITKSSVTPIVYMILLAFWSWHFSHMKENDIPLNLNQNGYDLNPEEQDQLGKTIGVVSYGTIPLLIPFMFFFNDTIKIIVPSALICAVIIVGTIYFRLRHGKAIKARLEKEEMQRQHQEKKERAEL